LGGVVVTMSEHGYEAPRVAYGNLDGTRLLVSHLLQLGHSRIGYITGPPDLMVTGARRRGYEAAMTEAGHGVDPDLVATGDFTIAGGSRAAGCVLGSGHTSVGTA